MKKKTKFYLKTTIDEFHSSLISNCMQSNESIIDEVGLNEDNAGDRGLRMLAVLAYVFSAHFQDVNILRHMISLLSFDEDYVAPYILKSFTYLGRYKPLVDSFPIVLEELAPICKEMALSGTPKQAKHAVRCMFVNMVSAEDNQMSDTISAMFADLVESLKTNLNASHPQYRTAIVSLGHIAYNLPEKYLVSIKNIISRKIVKELLVRDVQTIGKKRDAANEEKWCDEDDLPEETRCKVEGLKTMARWLLGLKNDVMSAQKTFRMLHAFIKQKGDLLEQGNLTASEMSWLRLSAGTAMLKICEQKGVGDQFTAEQFYNLSQLMVSLIVVHCLLKLQYVFFLNIYFLRSIQCRKCVSDLPRNCTKA